MSKILITGSEGVIGRELKQKLSEHALLCIDKKPGDNHLSLDLSQDYYAKLQEIRLFQPEYVFHLAASFERTEETPDFYEKNLRDNMLASLILNREVSHLDSVRCFVFASSYLIYDNALYMNKDKVTYLSEDMLVKPRNLCGMAKLYNEYELDFIQSHLKSSIFVNNFMRLVKARIFRVYGKDSQDIVSRSIKWTKIGEPITLWNQNNRFDYIHARDVAEGLKRLAFSSANGVYNVGSGVDRSIEDVMRIIGAKIRQATDPKLIGLPHEQSVADMTKTKVITNWVPEITLEQGIEELMAYYA